MTGVDEAPVAVQLRGGHVTLDRRLDRIPWFDDRSRGFQMRTLLAGDVPSSRSLAGKFWTPGPTLDQGSEGQCVAEGCTDRHNGAPLRRRPLITAFHDRQGFYEACQHRDPWPGCFRGHDGPAYGGTAVLAGMQEGRDRGYWREFRWIGAGSGRLEDDLIDTLRTVGGVVFGIPWLQEMYDTSPDGLVLADGPEVGGHCIGGWEWAPRQRMPRHWKGTRPGVWLHNSWGDAWGVRRRSRTGMGFLPLDDIDGRRGILSLLEAGGEGAVPLA